ncbi:MAG: hypothetical protein ACI8ZO_000532 [Flavobacteriales bacterium]|jgi:hypothetical protein
MKKLILSLALIAGTVISGVAQDAEIISNPNAAKIEFEKTLHDYGTIDKGANGAYEFKFTNTGKEPLFIQNAKGSCGCTVPSWPKEPIAPGATNVIKVKYDTKRIGPFSKSVTITSNSNKKTEVIKIKGIVKNIPVEPTSPVKKATPGTPVEKK